MHVDEQGLASGPPVVLIHGLGASSFSWRETAQAISATHRTYAVDLPGFGKSPAAGVKPTMKAQAVKLAEWIGRQSFSKPLTIIGHSMGGGVALYLADPAVGGALNIDKMVLIAPVAYPPDFPLGEVLARVEAVVNAPSKVPVGFSQGLAAGILKLAYAETSPVTPPQVDGYAAGLSTKDQLRAFVDHAKSLRDISPAFSSIKTKSLLIWGQDDTFVRPSLGTDLARDLGGAPLKLIPQCGHIPQEEKPAETNALIGTFL